MLTRAHTSGWRAADPSYILPACCRATGEAPIRRWAFAVLAYLFVGLAMIGVVVPGIPTFPFLLLAALALLFITVGTFLATRPEP
jgi:hypothetical protein